MSITATQAVFRPVASIRSSNSKSLLPRQGRSQVAFTHRQQNRTIARAVQDEEKPDVAKFADSIGLPTEEGIFGFKPFPEVWVGRLAMAGFTTSVVMELITKKGSLGQLGLLTPNPLLLLVLGALATGASVFAFGRTIARARSGNMTKTELKRYSKFLGISNEASDISETETEMKGNWNKESSADSPPEALTGSASDNPTDTFQTERARAPNTEVFTQSEQAQFGDPGLRYARDVEVQNGRAAMLGFLVTTMIEAWTGKGILSQVLWEFKLVGILGPASGF